MRIYDSLKRDCEQVRTYRGRSHYCDETAEYAAHMTRKYPNTNWQSYSRIVAGTPGRTPEYDIEVKHMVHWGCSDARVIEEAFQVQLPDSVHEFYRHITEAVFFWRKSFHFLSPDDIVAWEREIRQLTECEELPVHFITFCRTEGDYLGFRFNPRRKNWSIVYFTPDEFYDRIQGPENDDTFVTERIDQFLELLIKQDGLIDLDDRCFMQKVA